MAFELPNKFADFFSNKITAIRNELVTHPSYYTQSNQDEQYVQGAKFISFNDVTEHEIKYFIDKVDKKTCELDPVPATIFQGCKKSLLPLIAKIVNKSGCMPEKLKEAVLKPKLKNDSLNSDEYISFRPISNLKLLSKLRKSLQLSFWNIWLTTNWKNHYNRHISSTTVLKQPY